MHHLRSLVSVLAVVAAAACPNVEPEACDGGQTECNGVCVDTDSSPTNCGQCGRTCNSNQQCVGGTCKTYQWRLQTGTACNAWCGSGAAPFNVCLTTGQSFSCEATYLGGYVYIYGDVAPTNPVPRGSSAGQGYGWVHRWCDAGGCYGPVDPGGQTCMTAGTGDVHQCVLE